jgi:DNA-binding CsgD family transcriptional regulator
MACQTYDSTLTQKTELNKPASGKSKDTAMQCLKISGQALSAHKKSNLFTLLYLA